MARPGKGRRRSWRFRLNEDTVLEVSAPTGPTEKQVRRRGRVSLVLGTVVAMFALVAVGHADNVVNTLDTSIDATKETMNLTAGGATGSTYIWVQNVNVGGGDTNNACNLAGSASLTVGVQSTNPAVAAVGPSTVTIDECSSGDTSNAAELAKMRQITVTPVSAGSADITFSQTAFNGSGTFTYSTATFTVVVEAAPQSDTTPPVITPSVVGTLGNNGWYTSNVTVSWSVVDNESAVTSSSGCDPTTISSDTAATTLTCTATSAGGTASESVTIKRDATNPTISGVASPAPNGNGWNNTNVDVSFTCADAMSGIASCGPDQALSSEGTNQSASGTAVDNAGNSASTTVSGINIDKTPPTVALVGGPADGASYYFGFVPAAPTCTASDGLSGLDGSCSVSGYGTTVGPHTVMASASDLAGNTATQSHSYTVLAWTLTGFFQPVDMNGTYNVVKAGSTVPLKFRIFAGSTELTDISYVKSLTYVQATCSSSYPSDEIETVATGGTSLRYDSTDGQFVYNWKTPSMAGKCFRVTMTTLDGSSLVAYFKLK